MKVKFFTFLLLLCTPSLAQQGFYSSGARSESMSHCNSALSDDFSSINNIGALAGHSKPGVFSTYKTFWSLQGIRNITAGFNARLFGGNGSINFFRFGDQLFNEHKVGIGFSHLIRFTSLGMQVNYLQYHVEGYGTKSFLVLEVGGMAELAPGFYVAGYYWNLGRYTLSESSLGIEIPVVMKFGIRYSPDETFNLCIQVDHMAAANERTRINVGMEYFISGKVYLRSGFKVPAFTASFGTGLELRKLGIDYAICLHEYLGLSHHVSLTYQIKMK